MPKIRVLENTIQEYAWGSFTALAELLGQPSPAPEPQAEMWMGAHPKAPSRVRVCGKSVSLIELIEENPQAILGAGVCRKFGPRLPYLFKVLAAANPLSIQAHPSREQARRGFQEENRAGVPLAAPERNYKDENHKPECICALTPFWALNGFRKISEIISILKQCTAGMTLKLLDALGEQPVKAGLKLFFKSLLTAEESLKRQLIRRVTKYAQHHAGKDPAYRWVAALHEKYPTDIGLLAPLFLNLVRLEPGQAMFLAAGQLHAYLDGVGIELMANSDNVLRGGLTSKHVDLAELLKVLVFEELEIDILAPRKVNDHEIMYPTPAEEFALSVICPMEGKIFSSARERSVEILLCTQGEGVITDLDDGRCMTIARGCALLVPAAVTQYSIAGRITLYKAAVPL